MSENQEYTVFEADNNQAQGVTVTVNQGGDDVQQIQYITQDGTVVPTGQIVANTANVIQVTDGVATLNTQQPAAQVVVNQPQTQVVQGQTVVQTGGSSVATSLGIPQMLFLNQISVNGQTSFVLVDANNKPVQLPQGIQVINLPTQSPGQQIAMGHSLRPRSKKKVIEDETEMPKRKFKKQNQQSSYEWYQQDEKGLWHCTLCRAAGFSDLAYVHGRETPSKTTNHDRHAASKKHLDAITMSKLSSQQSLQKLVPKKVSNYNQLGLNLLKTAYHIGKRELPKEEFRPHLEYASAVGADYGELLSASAKLTYCSSKSVSELQSAISEVILEDRMSKIKCSGVYSLVLDESTDNANKKRVLMYVQSMSDSGLDYSFLSNKQLKYGSGYAKNIVTMVIDELKAKNLDISKLVGVSTDGASVMTEKSGGVVTLLKKHSPDLIGVHCVAHRTALATSQAARDIPEMNQYARTMSGVFKYFHNSAVHSNRLHEMQRVLNQPELKFTELHSVHWLSMESAVHAMYRSYPALVMCLEREAVTDAAAKGLYSEVCQYKFVATTHLMMDVLPFMSRLSMSFQKDSFDFSKIEPLVQSTCDCLKDLCEVPGEFLTKLDNFVKENDGQYVYDRPVEESCSNVVQTAVANNNAFEDFEAIDDESDDDDEANTNQLGAGFTPDLKYVQQQRGAVNRTFEKYIYKLVDNIESRFQDIEVTSAMKVLEPKNISSSESVAMYGMEEFRVLVKQFIHHVESEVKCVNEYRQYKRLVKGSYGSDSLVDITKTFISKYSSEFPNMVTLLKCCAVLPMSSVKCERGFATQNRIMSRLRTRINNKTMDDLMRISEEGPEFADFDFSRALAKWKAARKLFC